MTTTQALPPGDDGTDTDLHARFQQWTRLTGRAQQLIAEFWLKNAKASSDLPADPLGLLPTWTQLTTNLMKNPDKLAEAQAQFWQNSVQLWQAFATSLRGDEAAPVVASRPGDKRFSAKEWQEHAVFDFIRQSYLLAANFLFETVASVEGLDARTKAKAEFYTRQFIDAMAPTNFLLTNPQALKVTVEEQGKNLIRGLENLLQDIEQGRISMTDEKAFSVGGNVAVTPGKVVFENRIFQLIQYSPTTETTYETPLLICPPWINKFYILDLGPEKSFVKWALDQGLTVFMVSWINPDSSYRDTSFEDYMLDGEVKALEVVAEICNVKSVNVIGYCSAGTLLSATLAHLHAKRRQKLVKTATFFTAQVDFTEAGDLCVFVDEGQLELVDRLSANTGFLDSSYMATTFNLLRSNDLIWSYVVNNYLLGRDPFPFDLLYWNSDSTRMSRAMHLFYLEKLYHQNLLAQPGGITLGGTPIDLTKVRTPTYIQAGREDHIAPPRSVYKMTRLFSGPMRFMLAGSGHIAGVVNPPAARKYQHWTNDQLPETLDEFIAGATEHPGSWWPDWIGWLAPQSGKQVPARQPGGHPGYPPIEDAPGSYVKAK